MLIVSGVLKTVGSKRMMLAPEPAVTGLLSAHETADRSVPASSESPVLVTR